MRSVKGILAAGPAAVNRCRPLGRARVLARTRPAPFETARQHGSAAPPGGTRRGGRRRIPEGEVRRLQGETAEHPSIPGEAKGAVYAHVSSQDQKASGDLAR